MADMSWTHDQIETLRRLKSLGMHSAEIVRRFPKKSKGAVMGKLHRLSLLKQKDKNRRQVFNPKPKNLAPLPLAPRMDPPIDISREDGVELYDLKSHHCRWPFGDVNFYFCGRTKQEGSPYCEYHYKRARTGSQ